MVRARTLEHVYAVICAFREERRIAEVVEGARARGLNVIVVDDGSEDATSRRAEEAGAEVIRFESNRGKGAALRAGFDRIRDAECDAVITLDGDGQHDPGEIPLFLEAYRRTGIPALIGNRMAAPGPMPLYRRTVNRFMSHSLRKTTGVYLPDPPCGFRFYRADVLPYIQSEDDRFGAEFEMLLNMASRRIRMDNVRISSIYEGEPSRVRPVRDTLRFFSIVQRHRRRQKGFAPGETLWSS
ncbi:Undecaprenyl-phosphate 4-deoxy-4-formamido-L-arabinose transferase [Kiritimatiella glycovorans]|uniref:Undecaprenyl-phosphate 4-deoxy-4-formamido-L-arabinose transferase n=2 Tax=Kiritimatiella glycovorans TaxID=1307763 RepID=A0A0G3ELP1_9BACT|nr:Undecaprenyl-phosphate 4-deoxy-4-formamido-L-arabinose transferase [Kiritimatiella glycovorans]